MSRDVRDEIPVVVAPRLFDVPGAASLPQRLSLLLYSLLSTGRQGTSTSVCLEHTKCSMLCLCEMIVPDNLVQHRICELCSFVVLVMKFEFTVVEKGKKNVR